MFGRSRLVVVVRGDSVQFLHGKGGFGTTEIKEVNVWKLEENRSVSSVIRSYIEEQGISAWDIQLVVPAGEAMIKSSDLPSTSPSSPQSDLLESQIDELFPYDVDSIYWDRISSGGQGFIACVRRRLVDAVFDLAEETGNYFSRVEVPQFALFSGIRECHDPEEESVLYVYPSGDTLYLLGRRGDELQFHRTVDQVSDVPGQVKRTLDHLERNDNPFSPEAVCVVGVHDFHLEDLNIAVSQWVPKSFEADQLIGYGSLIHSGSDKGNLLPEAYKNRSQRRKEAPINRALGIVGLLILGLTLGAGHLWLKQQNNETAREIYTLRSQINQTESRRKTLLGSFSSYRGIDRSRHKLRSLFTNEYVFTNVIHDIGESHPGRMTLTEIRTWSKQSAKPPSTNRSSSEESAYASLSEDGSDTPSRKTPREETMSKTVSVSGHAYDPDRIHQFLDQLEQQPAFGTVNLIYSQKREVKKQQSDRPYEFRIDLGLESHS